MSEIRYFKNEFPDYNPNSATSVIDLELNELLPDVQSNIRRSSLVLLDRLEKELSEQIDWKDTSVYTGTSGYSLLYTHLAQVFDSENHLQKAINVAEQSLKCLRGRRLSFLCGDAGPLVMGAILYDKINIRPQVEFCVSNLVKLKGDVLDIGSSLPDELLYGRAGYLYALLLVKSKVNSELISTDLIRAVILAILDSGKTLSRRRKSNAPLAFEWHDKNYYGAAHGVAGILTLLLQVYERLTTSELNDLIRPTIDELASRVYPSGNLPSSEGSRKDALVHWCHGAPGAVFLFGYAYKIYKDPKYLRLAEACGKVIWERGLLKKGYGLCHGTAGNGYALLFLYQVTENAKYLYMAAQFAKWCCHFGEHDCSTPDRPYSLFEGMAGTIFFLTAFQNPREAKFPAFIL